MIKINGIEVPEAAGKTVSEYVAEAGYQAGTFAIERNEEILPKTDYDTAVIADGDVIEIVTFMGGGC